MKKTLETLEEQMTSWTPRSPSPGLEARIFRHRPLPSGGSTYSPILAWRNGWAPALAGTLALAMVAGVHSPVLTSRTWAALPLGDNMGASQFAALESASIHSPANNVVAASFTWTNAAQPHSTNASFGSETPQN